MSRISVNSRSEIYVDLKSLSTLNCFSNSLLSELAHFKKLNYKCNTGGFVFPVQCDRLQERYDIKQVIQGEGLYWPCPNLDCSKETNDLLISWFKNGSNGMQQITSEESARIHHHGPVLYILPLTLNDTGYYITRWSLFTFSYIKCTDKRNDSTSIIRRQCHEF